MPALQFEQQICDWIEEPHGETSSPSRQNLLVFVTASALEKSTKDVHHVEPYLKSRFGFRCARYGDNPAQDIWDLAHAAHVKVTWEAIDEYESKRLIEEINQVYDEEMEREDEEFLRHAKGYQKRALDLEAARIGG